MINNLVEWCPVCGEGRHGLIRLPDNSVLWPTMEFLKAEYNVGQWAGAWWSGQAVEFVPRKTWSNNIEVSYPWENCGHTFVFSAWKAKVENWERLRSKRFPGNALFTDIGIYGTVVEAGYHYYLLDSGLKVVYGSCEVMDMTEFMEA